MEELNVFGDDFLSNGEFHHLYTTFNSQDDICLWDNRIDFDFQSKWNSTSDFGNDHSSHSDYGACQVTGYINFVENNNYSGGEIASPGSSRNNLHATSNGRDQNYAAISTNNFLDDICDMDEWKQNHLDDLLYQSNNSNSCNADWELSLDNLIMENPFEDSVFNVCDLPARTFYCNDSCTSFLEETSEHLDTSLRTFQPNSTYETTISIATHSNYNTVDRKKCTANATEEKEFVCNYGECRKVYAKAGHLKAHIRRHIGDKPYVCLWPNCTWKFSRSDELSRHRRSHSGIKPYQCDLCPKCFSRSVSFALTFHFLFHILIEY